ncbi:MAG: hypothetical protein E6J71_25980 [Deltaproteobacteria bacterium]|nr:MAG: hypothetical protein E6J71_25980 [Deltaproteobacteria bacterium]
MDSSGHYSPGTAGFNLADVSSVSELDSLPGGVKGLVWLGLCNGADSSFINAVQPFIGNPKLFGFYLMDEPDPTGQWAPLCPAANLMAESDWIHANAPGAQTFIVMMNFNTSVAPTYANTYNPGNSHIDLYGIDPYPCRTETNGCDYDMITVAVAAAKSSGIPLGSIVPVYQAFGGGSWADDGGGKYTLPTSSQAQQIMSTWAPLVPNPVFDYAYSWGTQSSDQALEGSTALQAVFAAHNAASAGATTTTTITLPPITPTTTTTTRPPTTATTTSPAATTTTTRPATTTTATSPVATTTTTTRPPTTTSTTVRTSSTTTTTTQSSSTIGTVFLIVMENTDWSSIKGSSSAPYINGTLLPRAAHAEQYYNPPNMHPSLPNYLWLEAGTNFGILDDNEPSSNHQSTTSHLVNMLETAGISWKTYQEDEGSGAWDGSSCPTGFNYGNRYDVNHNPFAYFTDITNTTRCIQHVRPYSEFATNLASNTVPRYNFIVPDLCHDMHENIDCSQSDRIKFGDTWLSTEVPKILASQAYLNNGALFITWDEAASGDGPIGMIVLSPKAKGGGYSNTITYHHSSTLRTMQEIFNVTTPMLGGPADVTNAFDLRDLFVSFP